MSFRAVLHCDLDNFFASVEGVYRPELKNVPFAVCGSEQERHGIVLAKNPLAKKYGVKTAEAIWQAKAKCPELTVVEPHYDRYLDFSRRARSIYEGYTDMVESFGVDECWLDVTGSHLLFGDGETIAREINKRVKKELGITVSIGVSFNKCFAKLGSDLNKPDGISIITPENFKKTVWPLSADKLLWVGSRTARALESMGLYTVGDIAAVGKDILTCALGKSGTGLWINAMGLDTSPVLRENELPAAKSIGKSMTGRADLKTDDDVRRTLLYLSENVSETLRLCGLLAGTVQIHVRDCMLMSFERQMKLDSPTRLTETLAGEGMKLFRQNWDWRRPVRSVGIRACELMSDTQAIQMRFGFDFARAQRLERLGCSVDSLREKYGRDCIRRASLLMF